MAVADLILTGLCACTVESSSRVPEENPGENCWSQGSPDDLDNTNAVSAQYTKTSGDASSLLVQH